VSPSRLAVTLPVFAVLLALAPAASAGTRLVAPAGADSGDCRVAPCKSLAYSYQRSASGDVITIAPGVYESQEVPALSKAVTFRGSPGNKIRQLHNHASNVTYDGLNIDSGFTTPNGAAFENHTEPGGVHVTFKNGRIGNVKDQKGALFGGWNSTASQHLVIDNVDFHDVLHTSDGVHNECIFSQSPGLTIRNSTFRNCATMDVSLNRGDWWGQPPYGGVTLENNVFGHSIMDTSGWHHYGLAWFIGAFAGARVVNNTFENAVLIDENNIGSGPYSGVWANNIGGGWECLNGVTYRNNVGKSCHSSDRSVSPASACGPPNCSAVRMIPVGFVNPAGFDFRLKSGSPAIDVANPSYATPRDHDGKARGARPDAGAFEFGAGGGGAPTVPARTRPRIRFASLRPKVICKPARAGCPSTARLRVRVSRRAKVSVQIQRVRSGHKPKRVRKLGLRTGRKAAGRLRARSLHRGRYRLKLVARDLTGMRSKAKFLKLVVR
jgi:hypothetical protein